MDQYWNLVCMDNRQIESEILDLNVALSSCEDRRLVDLLTVPIHTIDLLPLPIETIKTLKEVSHIERLPLEIQTMICSFLDNIEDMMCFALTCHRFLEVGRNCIIQRHASIMSPWAGKRLIYVGTNTEDYPNNFLTKHEESELSNISLPEYIEQFDEIIIPERPSIQYYDRIRCLNLNPELLKVLSPESLYPIDSETVLRNLTTREYIRASDLDNANEFVGLGFGLGNMLLSRICWSSDPEGSLKCNRGIWAGHRFDIITIDKVDQSWKDVGNQVIQEFVEIINNMGSKITPGRRFWLDVFGDDAAIGWQDWLDDGEDNFLCIGPKENNSGTVSFSLESINDRHYVKAEGYYLAISEDYEVHCIEEIPEQNQAVTIEEHPKFSNIIKLRTTGGKYVVYDWIKSSYGSIGWAEGNGTNFLTF